MMVIFSIEAQSRDFQGHMMGGGPGGVVSFDLGKKIRSTYYVANRWIQSQSLQWRLLQPFSVFAVDVPDKRS